MCEEVKGEIKKKITKMIFILGIAKKRIYVAKKEKVVSY